MDLRPSGEVETLTTEDALEISDRVGEFGVVEMSRGHFGGSFGMEFRRLDLSFPHIPAYITCSFPNEP
jgi:hypothetical protein